MRYFTILALTFISIACQNNENDSDNLVLSYSVDTVFIDSRGRLLDLDHNIYNSALNTEESSIFLFNRFDHSLDEVNLDDLEVVEHYPFEAEGPDGTGEHVNFINLLDDNSIFIKSFGASAVFDPNGGMLKKIDWANSTDSKGLKYGKIPQNEVAVVSKDLKVFGLSYDNRNRDVFLDVLSVRDNSVNRFDIDSLNSYHDFVLTIPDPYTFLDPLVYLKAEDRYVIISHQFSHEIHLFNSEGEFVQTVYYSPQLTPNRVKGLNGRSLSSIEQLGKEYQHLLEQVRFGPPVWDKEKKRYLRLSATRTFPDTPAKQGSLLPEVRDTEVFLSVFDPDFNLISELAIPELDSETAKYFAKDGKLWVFRNFSDELGFIVIDIPEN